MYNKKEEKKNNKIKSEAKTKRQTKRQTKRKRKRYLWIKCNCCHSLFVFIRVYLTAYIYQHESNSVFLTVCI